MTILPDGRYKLGPSDIRGKVWEKIKGWIVDDINNPQHLIPNFPECKFRQLISVCSPCGRQSALNYHCSKIDMYVSVSWCQQCTVRET